MGGISSVYEERILNAVLRGESVSFPGQVYVALFTSDPTDAGTGNEVSGGGYERQAVLFTEAEQVAGKGTSTNSTDVQFPVAEADWGTVTHIALYDALSDGNLVWHGPLNEPEEISENNLIEFPAGNIVVDLD